MNNQHKMSTTVSKLTIQHSEYVETKWEYHEVKQQRINNVPCVIVYVQFLPYATHCPWVSSGEVREALKSVGVKQITFIRRAMQFVVEEGASCYNLFKAVAEARNAMAKITDLAEDMGNKALETQSTQQMEEAVNLFITLLRQCQQVNDAKQPRKRRSEYTD